MRTIDDFEHFVLAPGETLILRFTKPMTAEQLLHARTRLAEALPGRPVMILPSDMEVCAGMLELIGGEDESAMREADMDTQRIAEREAVERAYNDGRMVYCKDVNNAYGWFYIHKEANPITGWAWDLYDYRLTKPKPGE